MTQTQNSESPADLLARHLCSRLSKQSDPVALLTGLRTELPAAYHSLIDTISHAFQRTGSLATALQEQRFRSLRRLGALLAETDRTELGTRLQHWQAQQTQLQRISSLVQQAWAERHYYLLALITVFSVVCMMWLTFVASAYQELFQSFSSGAQLPGFSRLLVNLAVSDHFVAVAVKLLITLLPFLALASLITLKWLLKRLQRGDDLPPWLARVPALNRLPALQQLLLNDANADAATLGTNPLLTESEVLSLRLAGNGGYFASELARLQQLPDALWAERVTRPLRRVSAVLLLLVWAAVGFFLVAAYQPIFSLGAAV